MKYLLCLVLLFLCPSGVWAQEAEAQPAVNGTVTLSLDRFLQLTRTGPATPPVTGGPAAPVTHLFPQGDYRVSVEDRFARVEADLKLSVYGQGWVSLDLLASPVVLESAHLDGQPLLTQPREEGGLTALVHRTGSHQLKLVYYLPLANAGASRSFALLTPASAVSRLRLVVPGKDIEITSNPKIPLNNVQKSGATVVSGALPGGASVTFSWTPLAAHPALRGKPKNEKPRMYARLFTLATVGERDVRLTSQVQLSILRNSVQRFRLQCPKEVEVVDVQGAHLASWTANDHQIDVRLSEPVSGEYSFTVTYEKPLTGDTWSLPTLTMDGLERVKGSIGILSTGGVELTQGTLQEARPIDVKELPTQVCAMTSNPLMLAYEYHQQPYQISLSSHKGEELPVLTAAIEGAEALTLVTEEGKLVSAFTYTMRNNRKQFLKVTLPPRATVYGAFVSGKAVKPIQDGENQVRIPLASAGQESFPVELAYVQEENTSGWLGSSHLIAPKVDVPICNLNWSIYQPPSRTVFWTGGTMAAGQRTLAVAGAVGGGERDKDMDGAAPTGQAAPAPSAEASIADEKESYARKTQGRMASGEGYFKADNRMANIVRSATQGAFPVRVEIPRQGRVLEFSQLMVTHDSPQIVLHYSSQAARQLIWLGVALVTAGLGLSQRRRPRGWKLLLAAWAVLVFGNLESTPVGLVKGALWLGWVISLLGWLASQRGPWQDYLQAWRRGRGLVSGAVLVLMFSTSTPPAHAQGPGGGTVTVPLADFLKLSQKKPGTGSRPADTAPTAWLLTAGDYRVQAASGARWGNVDAQLSLSILHGGWQEIDLLPGEVVLQQALFDGQSVPVYNKEGRYHALVRGPGQHKLRLQYHLAVSSEGAASTLALVTPATQASSLRLVLPAGMKVTSSPEVPFQRRSATLTEGAFSAPNLSLSWSSAAASAQLNGQSRGEKARLTARVYSLLSVSDTVARCKTRIDYQILRNEVDTLSVLVPVDAEVVDVACEGLANWTTSERGNARQVNLFLAQPASGTLSVTLSLEKGISQIDSTWDVPTLEVPGVERMKGSLGVETSGGIEVTAATQDSVRPIDVAELPAEVSGMCSNPTVLAFEYHRQPYRLALETHKGKEVNVLTATIDKGRGETLVTPEGKLVTHLLLSVRNNHKQYLELQLPAGAEVWSTFVNGQAVKPIKAEGGKVRMRLESSRSGESGVSAFPAEITYVQQSSLHPWLGKLEVQVPQVDMPISDLGWQLYLPQEWKVLRLGGTMQEATSLEPIAAGAPQPVQEQQRSDAPVSDRLQQMVSAAQQGVLPVRVEVPKVGQVLTFQRLMVTEESPVIQVTLTSKPALEAADWMFFAVSLMLGAWLALKPRGWILLLTGYLACRMVSGFQLPLLGSLQSGLGVGLALWLLNHFEALLAAWQSRRRAAVVPDPAPAEGGEADS
ncbi:hypothetical protein IV102_14205 [bacterium]|nr:hypothetical protein [bacterium]